MTKFKRMLPPPDQLDRMFDQARKEADYWYGSDNYPSPAAREEPRTAVHSLAPTGTIVGGFQFPPSTKRMSTCPSSDGLRDGT